VNSIIVLFIFTKNATEHPKRDSSGSAGVGISCLEESTCMACFEVLDHGKDSSRGYNENL
jgi:hypothetical protein